MGAITTHVLDTARGVPVADLDVLLEVFGPGDRWQTVGRGRTDADGRLRTLMESSMPPVAGTYRLVFETRAYFEALGTRAFYPVVVVTFEVAEGDSHYHVPLLLGPFGYTTYRGS